MKEITIQTEGKAERYSVFCGAFAADPSFREELRSNGILFTDTNVYALYREKIDSWGVPLFVMEAGEENKNEQTLFALLGAMAQAGIRRKGTLAALGGGVVGDVGGLAAGLYMRGISCIQIPTTILAQVDSSVGGKTAIDLNGIKNLIGVFKQPKAVYADPSFFATLPPREVRCGLGEIIKHGALCPPLFEKLWAERSRLSDLDFLAEIVPENIAYKAEIVRQDPCEKGLRRCLNLGHTTAHAFELSGAGLSHGECVLLGLMAEGMIARTLYPCDGEFLERLFALCRSVLLPPFPEISLREAAEKAELDKKNVSRGEVVLTLPIAAGKYEICSLPHAVYEKKLEEVRRELC